MEKALIIGSSGGIGSALVVALEARGVLVTGLSRSRHGLDVTDEASVAEQLGALDGPFDLISSRRVRWKLMARGPRNRSRR